MLWGQVFVILSGRGRIILEDGTVVVTRPRRVYNTAGDILPIFS